MPTSNDKAAKEIQLYSLYEVARVLNVNSYKLQRLIENDEIATPAAEYKTGSQLYWTDESIPAWKDLLDKETERLMNMAWKKDQLIDLVIDKAKSVERQAKSAYPRGRGSYSMQGARLSVVKLEGIIEFVGNLGESGLGTEEQRKEIKASLQAAKMQLDMK